MNTRMAGEKRAGEKKLILQVSSPCFQGDETILWMTDMSYVSLFPYNRSGSSVAPVIFTVVPDPCKITLEY